MTSLESVKLALNISRLIGLATYFQVDELLILKLFEIFKNQLDTYLFLSYIFTEVTKILTK